MMWLILAMMIILTLNAERFLTGDGPILLLLSVVLIPIALAIAIVRYQLFDIRVVLSRTLLYGLTIALVIGVYVGAVAGFTLLVPSSAQRSVSVAAAIVVAFLFCARAVTDTTDDQPRLLRHPVRPRPDRVADR
jgi:hypothetical protein